MQVDLTGTFNVTRMAIPHLKKSSAGVIINMSSVAGRFGYPNRSPYAPLRTLRTLMASHPKMRPLRGNQGSKTPNST